MSCERVQLSLFGKTNQKTIETSTPMPRPQRGSWVRGCMRLLGAVAVTALWMCHSAGAASSPPAMIVPGQFNVGATGAASYTIPIAVPPGTAGMLPALSLDYSSQSGDGIVGLGWSLSGLPSVVRCPRTLSQDSVHGGVNYDSNDRFCMEGQRLVAISGSYGENGTEYRTEIDGFSRIVSYGSSGNGPSYFKVWTKSGQIMEFGNTSDAKLLAVGTSTARSWAVNKISDTKGNYLTVTYTNDATNGQAYPSRIDYTGNANTGLATYNSIQFSYNASSQFVSNASRPDVTPTYQAGSLQQTTVLLTNVRTYQGVNLVYDYQLGYRLGSSTTHSRLTSVTLCDGSGSNCLAPTTFGWQGGSGLPTMTAVPNSLAQGKIVHYGNGNFYTNKGLGNTDFNGDGLADLLVEANSYPDQCPALQSVYYSTPTGTFSQSTATAAYTQNDVMYKNGNACFFLGSDGGTSTPYTNPIDLNSDGIPDAVVFFAGPIHYMLNDGLNHFQEYSTTANTYYPYGFGDFNGDGQVDVLTAGGYLLNSSGTFTYSARNFDLYGPKVDGNDQVFLADFDGDGCTDRLQQYAKTLPKAIVYSSDCSPAVSQIAVPDWTHNNYRLVFGDFNGDGKTDILVLPNSGTALATLYISSGTSLVSYSLSGTGDWSKYTVYAGDFNGDGKTDLLLVADGSSGHYGVNTSHKIMLSTGSGFVQASTIANTNSADTSVSAAIGDFNNDGTADIWLQKPSGDTEELFSFVPEVITSVANGIGATTTITYDRLNKNGSFYTKCPNNQSTYVCGDTYPTIGVDGPIYVVSRVDASNGVAGTYSSTYSYAGAKSDLRGRGFQGFQQMTVTDPQTGVIQTTNYRTDFPYVGLISSQAKTANGATLSLTTNTYSDASEGTSTEGVARHFVSLTQSVVAANDLDGSAMPTTTTNYTYDSYGNALTVNTSVSDRSSKNTSNSYTNDTTNWFLGRLTGAQVTSVVGASTITRTSCFQYNGSSGLLTREVIEPVSIANCTYSSTGVQTDYTYDAYGHRTQTTVSGTDFATRSSSAGYDPLGEFQTSATNALTQSESWAYDARFGVPTSHTGPNGLTTRWTYDTFGRALQQTNADGTIDGFTYRYCTGVNGNTYAGDGCDANEAFYTDVKPYSTDGSTQRGARRDVYYDALGRARQTQVQFDAGAYDWVFVDTEYDSNGRVARVRRPYFYNRDHSSAGAWTTYNYDALGRLTQANFPNGGYTTYDYRGLVGIETAHVYDSVTKTWKTETKTTAKNAQGLVASVTDALSHTTSYAYDAYGNLTSVTDPNGNQSINVYDTLGHKKTSSDPDMGSWSYGYDALGELTSQTDAKGQTSSLNYDVLGRLAGASEGSFTRSFTYDTAAHGVGRLATTGSATTAGTLYIAVSGDQYLGSPRAQVAVDGNVIGTYDVTAVHASGQRQTIAITGNFSTASTISVSFINDACCGPNGEDRNLYVHSLSLNGVTLDAATQATSTGALVADGWVLPWNTAVVNFNVHAIAPGSSTQRTFSYDSLGRPSAITLSVGGASYTYTDTYDANGRLATVAYPSGFTARYVYTGLGYLSQIKDNGSGAAYWTLNARDAELHLVSQTFGNDVTQLNTFDANTGLLTNVRAGPSNDVAAFDYTYDTLGNLIYRADGLQGIFENACYDSLNRLTQYAVGNGVTSCTSAQNAKTIGYDALGNIASKSDVGNYSYPAAGQARPHAVASITGTVNGVVNPSYSYDANGNMTAGAGRSVTYTSFNMAASIAQGSTTIAFAYDSEHARVSMTVPTGTTTYVNDPASGAMSEKVVSGSTTTWHDYIMVDGKIIAEKFSGGTTAMRYFVLDHLGSVAVVTDEARHALERNAYDAWGKRRNQDGSDDSSCSLTSQTTRGFTGHEEIDSVCLVNANARIYDAALGRFMSADPTVEAPYNLQILNRYSYVGNNPLSFTDPSGMCFLGCFWNNSTFRGVVSIAVAIILENPRVLGALGEGSDFIESGFGTVVNGAAIGGIAGGISGGTLKSVGLGMLQGGLFAEAGNLLAKDPGMVFNSNTVSEVVAHGFVGGITSVAGGGKFGSGFLAAGVSSLADLDELNLHDVAANTAEHAVFGGFGSVLGGGKFANGAMTGAFGYLFNYEMHRQVGNTLTGKASYYGTDSDGFIGKTMSNGQPMDPDAMTAAVLPNSIPLGSTVNVSLVNDPSQSITVTITDNGMVSYPLSRAAGQWVQNPATAGRIIDLTPTAFEALAGGLGAGTVDVNVKIITVPNRIIYFSPPKPKPGG